MNTIPTVVKSLKLMKIMLGTKFLHLGAVVADITSFLTETVGNFWFGTPSEGVFGGWYYAYRVEEDETFP